MLGLGAAGKAGRAHKQEVGLLHRGCRVVLLSLVYVFCRIRRSSSISRRWSASACGLGAGTGHRRGGYEHGFATAPIFCRPMELSWRTQGGKICLE